MIYLVDDYKYHFSYQEIHLEYQKVLLMSDEEFINNLPKVLHLSCFIAYLKELSNKQTIGDLGIIHRLILLLHIPEEEELKEVRKQFENILKIAK